MTGVQTCALPICGASLGQKHGIKVFTKGEKSMTKRETIVTFIKDMLRPRTLKEIIDIELRDAYLSKMQAEKSLQYAQSLVEYNRQRIRVLEEKLKELNDA